MFSRPPVPAAPSGLVAAEYRHRFPRTVATVHLRWVDHSHNETGFIVERRVEDGSTEYITGQPNENQMVRVERNLQQGKVYTYTVYATHDFGTSGPSNTVRLTTDP